MDSNYKQAEDNNIKFEQLSSEKDEKLLEAKNDARKKYVEVIEEFKNQRNGILLDKQDFENYIAFSKKWLSECHRILKKGGTIYVFIGFKGESIKCLKNKK